VITRNDPHTRGIVILGLGAREAELAASFQLAAKQPLVKGFAVGRTIFGDAARAWMKGEMSDADAVSKWLNATSSFAASGMQQEPALWKMRMNRTIRLTAAQAMVRYIAAQLTEDGEPFVAGCWAIFGHGNVAGLGEALYASRNALPTYRGRNEQTMAHAAIAYSKQLRRKRTMMVTSSIEPGATNMLTAAALAHVNRLPVLLVPGDVFANRGPDPVLQQIEDFADGTVSVNDVFKPVSRYFDRITRPEQLLTALPRAFRTMTDPADCGPVTLAFCQDAQAEAYDFPVSFFEPKVWYSRRIRPDEGELSRVAEVLKAARRPVIVAGGGVHYADATETLKAFAEAHNIPVAETQAGKSALSWDHPLNLGSIGVTGGEPVNDICSDADVVLGVGTRFQDFTTGSWGLLCKPKAADHQPEHGRL